MNADARVKAYPPAANDVFRWLTAGRFAAVLGVLVVAGFPAVASGQRTFVFGDYGLFRLFLAGLGMYLLANQWTASRLAASVAGTSFAFSGLALHCLIWPNNIAALGWMPWVVLCVDRATQVGGKNTLIAAAAGAMQMLAGAPEVILFTWTIALLLCLSQWFRVSQPARASLQRLATVAVLVTGLAAVQLLPFLDLLAHSPRDTSQANTDCAMPITGWANFLVPLFRCTSSP